MNDDQKTLRLVQGGRSPAGQLEQDWGAKLKELKRFDRTLRYLRNETPGPRGGFALLFGILAAGLIVGAERLLLYFGVWVDGGVATLAAVIVFLTTVLMVVKFSRIPQSYFDVLDEQLMNYEPVTIDEYRWLQEQVSSHGLNCGVVQQWLDKERHALAAVAGWPKPGGASFVSRKL